MNKLELKRGNLKGIKMVLENRIVDVKKGFTEQSIVDQTRKHIEQLEKEIKELEGTI